MSRQLQEKAIAYKSGFEQIYNRAKLINFVIVSVSFIIAIISVINNVIKFDFKNLILFLTFIWILVSLWLSKRVDVHRKRAADLQELYDIYILGIEKNSKIMYPQERRYIIKNRKKINTEKYYDIDEDHLTLRDILYIQENNITYDINMRKIYLILNEVYMFIYIVTMLTFSILLRLDVYDLAVFVILPSINVVNYLSKNILNLNSEVKQLNETENDIISSRNLINIRDKNQNMNEIRRYQDLIYFKRRNWIIIPNYIYRWYIKNKDNFYVITGRSNGIRKKCLQEEAISIEKQLGIIEFLERYGRAEIVGSVANNLIVDRDIDIHLLTKEKVDNICEKLILFLRAVHNVSNIEIEDYKSDKQSICVVIENYNEWSIEIWISNSEEYVGFKLKEDLEKLLNKYNREIIMQLKRYYYRKRLLYGQMSTYIYKAVIYGNVKNLEEFKIYIKKSV